MKEKSSPQVLRATARGRGVRVASLARGGRGPTTSVLLMLMSVLSARAASGDDHERGDVPGWVMITLMSAVLVAALLAIAAPALQGLFEQAIQQVQPRR